MRRERCIDSEQHRRGRGPKKHARTASVPVYRQRVGERVGYPIGDLFQDWIYARAGFSTSYKQAKWNQQNAERAHRITRKEGL